MANCDPNTTIQPCWACRPDHELLAAMTGLLCNISAAGGGGGGGSGTVTSVNASGGTTGMSFTGGPVTTSGTLTLTGTLAPSNGGTGITALGAGVATFLGTPSSANLAAAVTDETGTGALVFATSPTFVTPNLGTPASGNLTNATGVARMPAFTTLTDAATVVWAMDANQNEQTAQVTLGGNRTLSITGAVNGMRGVLKVIQDATGTRTLAMPAGSKVINGGGGVMGLTGTGAAVDIIAFLYDGTNFWWNIGKNFT